MPAPRPGTNEFVAIPSISRGSASEHSTIFAARRLPAWLVAGCTEAGIAATTGHSLRDVGAILDAHYLHRDAALAANPILKLERGTQAPKWVGLFCSAPSEMLMI